MYFYKQIKFATANGAVGGITYNCPSIGNIKFTVLLSSAEDTIRDMISNMKNKDILWLICNGKKVTVTTEVGRYQDYWVNHYKEPLLV